MTDEDAAPLDFVEAVIRVIEAIPPGEVLTYADVAALVGSRAARAVGRVLAHYGHALPWWRVVRADGTLLKGFEAAALEQYEQEGTPLRRVNGIDRVDLRAARRPAEGLRSDELLEREDGVELEELRGTGLPLVMERGGGEHLGQR